MPGRLFDPVEARRLSEQMGDIEFQMDIAPNLNYRGPIDPSKARLTAANTRYRGVRIPALEEFAEEHFQGVLDDSTRSAYRSALENTYEGAPGIYAAGVENANPALWAHEYRHEQGIRDENANRMLDAWNAQSMPQWNQAVRNHMTYRQIPTMQDAQSSLLDKLRQFEMSKLDQYQDYAVPNPIWRGL